MKVILINPPRAKLQVADFPPLGLGYLGAIAKKAGHRVRLIDASAWAWDKLREVVNLESPDVIGLTCWTIERGQTFRAAHVAKVAAPKAKILIGGPHASAFPHHIFLKTPADFVVRGEGENTFQELLCAIECDSDPCHIEGIAYRYRDGIRETPSRRFIKDLDEIPFPLHEQWDYGSYKGMYDTPRRAAAIITSRGCPFRCIFCSSAAYWGHKIRKRSVRNVTDEIELLYHHYDIRALLFFDDNFVIDRDHCIAISKSLCEKGLDLIWAAEGNARVDAETLKWMKRAGCYRIDFGIESGSPEILRNINKAHTVSDVRRAFRLCRELGIKPNAYLMIGSPGETRHTIKETVHLMKEIQPDAEVNRAGVWVLPDTMLYEMSLSKGIIGEKDWAINDETPIYTGEHSPKTLKAMVYFYNRRMALNKGLLPYLKVLLRQLMGGSYSLWKKRGIRLIKDPLSLWRSVKKRFIWGLFSKKFAKYIQ